MRKFTFFIKKLTIIIFTVLFTMQSFAAIVSDNDGSAFVTKAEFDALKEEFNRQINSYQDSLENKIDGAISSYLAGIKLAEYESKDLKYAGWKKVIQLNYKPEVTWQLPNLNLFMSMNETLTATDWKENSYATKTIKYNRPDSSKQKIFMCDAGAELTTSNGPTNVTWKGRSINYKDTLTVNLQGTNSSGYYQGVNNASIRVYYWARFGTGGYYSSLNSSANSIWNPNFYYWHSSNSSYRKTMSSSWTSKNASTTVSLEKDSLGNESDYTHIIAWGDSMTDFRLCDPNWLLHINSNPSKNVSSYPTSSGSNGLTLTGNYGIMESWVPGIDIKRVTGDPTAYKGSATNSYTSSAPVIGLLGNSYNATNIYQINEKFSESVDNAIITSSTIPTLPDGFPLLAAKKGDEIIWNPVFTNSTKGSTTNYNTDIALYLSVGPMGASSALKSNQSVRIKNADDNDSEYFIIKGNKGKVSFEMPADGIVYAKWRHNPEYTTGNWEITLNLEECGSYQRKKAE